MFSRLNFASTVTLVFVLLSCSCLLSFSAQPFFVEAKLKMSLDDYKAEAAKRDALPKEFADKLGENPTDVELWVGLASALGKSYKAGGGIVAVAGEEISDPVEALARAVAIQPMNGTLWTTLAFWHYQHRGGADTAQEAGAGEAAAGKAVLTIEGQTYDRVQMLQKALQLDPKLEKAWLVLSGVLARREGNIKDQAQAAQSVTVNGDEIASSRAALEKALEVTDGMSSGAWVEIGKTLDRKIHDSLAYAMAGGASAEAAAAAAEHAAGQKKHEQATVAGVPFTRRQCFENAVKSDQGKKDFLAVFHLASDLLIERARQEKKKAQSSSSSSTAEPAAGDEKKTVNKAVYTDEAGKQWDARALLVRSIELESNFAQSWKLLADTLDPDDPNDTISLTESATTVDGAKSVDGVNRDASGVAETFTKREMYERALALAPNSIPGAWISLAAMIARDPKAKADIAGTSYTATECLRRGLALDPKVAVAWVLLGQRLVKKGAKADVGGSQYTRRECMLKAVELDDKISSAWAGLGGTLRPGESVTSAKGEKIDGRLAFQRAVEANPSVVHYWTSLAATVPPDQTVTLRGVPKPLDAGGGAAAADGPSTSAWTAEELLLHAVALSPHDTATYGFLAQRVSLRKAASVQLPASTGITEPQTPKQLYMRALEGNPRMGFFWYALGGMLQKGETATIGGEEVGQFSCLLRTVRHAPQHHAAWVNLAMTLEGADREKTVQVVTNRNGKEVTLDLNKRELLVFALDAEPSANDVWQLLAKEMDDKDAYSVRGKRVKKADIEAAFSDSAKKAKK